MENNPYIFIVNPFSGTGKQKGIEEKIVRIASKYTIQPLIISTKHAGHASEIAREFRDKAKCIVVAGGDGSVNETGRELLHSNTSMGIIPAGSGNGLARHLKIPLTIEKAIEKIFVSKEKTMDIGKVDEHIFLSTAGFGFDAKIAHVFSTNKKRGFSSYIKTVRKELLRYQPIEYRATGNFQPKSGRAFMLSIANIPQFGNNFTINPLAKEDDGELNFTLIKPFPKIKIPVMVNKFFRGTIDRSRYFENFKSTDFELVVSSRIGHVDGEPITLKSEKTVIQIQKGSLKIMC